jgi:hypothetical protein
MGTPKYFYVETARPPDGSPGAAAEQSEQKPQKIAPLKK